MPQDQQTNEIAHLRYQYLGKALVDELTAATPNDWVLERPIGGGGNAPYVPGFRFIERLNTCFGLLWSFDALEAFTQDGHVVVKGELTVHVPGQSITIGNETRTIEPITIKKVQYGSSEVKKYRTSGGSHKAGDMLSLGNDFKAAATDALKKCGILFGMFSDVYRQRAGEEEGSRPTKQQLEAVYLRGKNFGWSPEETDKWIESNLKLKLSECDQMTIMSQVIPALIAEVKKLKEGQQNS